MLKKAKEYQEDARQHDEWEDILRERLAGVEKVTLSEVGEKLGINTDRLDKSMQTRLGLVMKAIHFARQRDTKRGLRTYYWIRSVSP
jgi:hypothetical protein